MFTATDFLVAATPHIPDKGAQIVKYYGWYSNKARGQRAKAVGRAGPPGPPLTTALAGPAEVLSDHPSPITHRRLPSRTWRELIKMVWDADPLACPKCGGVMKPIALIEEQEVIEKILRHLDLWEEPTGPSGPSPPAFAGASPLASAGKPAPLRLEPTYEPFYDDIPFGPDNSFAE